MQFFILIIVALLILVGILLAIVILKQKSFGSVAGNRVYSDTQHIPGEVIYSDELQLKGKPDYVIKEGDSYIPIEVKTGKTPSTPYQNHVMQLLAYCALVETTYNTKVPYGIVKYPEREFRVEYTQEMKNNLFKTLAEMRAIKESGEEPICTHPQHNIH